MTPSDVKALLAEASRFYLAREMSGRAYSRLAENLIALSGFEDTEPELERFAELLASYSPGIVDDGLISDKELRRIVQQLLDGFPAV